LVCRRELEAGGLEVEEDELDELELDADDELEPTLSESWLWSGWAYTVGVSRWSWARSSGGDWRSKSGKVDSSRKSERVMMISPLRSSRTR
jgi:hypothetical protein